MAAGGEGSSERAFTARRVPDFARLHALEEARVARWKRQNKKTVTVPLAFRLAPDASKIVNSAPAAGEAATGGDSARGPSRSDMGAQTPGRDRALAPGKEGKTGAYEPGHEHKENKAVQGGHVGAPSEHLLYPTAFNRKLARTGKRDSHVSMVPSQGGVSDRPISSGSALRPLSTRDVTSALAMAQFELGAQYDDRGGEESRNAEPGRRAANDARMGRAGADASGVGTPVPAHSSRRAAPAHAHGTSGAPQERGRGGKPLGDEAARTGRAAAVPAHGERDGAPHGGASTGRSGPSSTGSNLSAIVAQEGAGQKNDPAKLREDLEKLPADSPVQPFSSLNFYQFGKTLGEGAYGKVKLGTHLLTHEKVAVKTFEKSKLSEPQAMKRVAREIRILKALDHPHIIKLYEVVETTRCKYLIMQYSSAGDLCRYVREKRRLSEPEACRLFVQIVAGLQYCHASGIVHRDVKLDNLLIDADGNIKIVDFGFSVSFKAGQKLKKACGSPSYAAPEIVSRKSYAPTGVDVWSLGVVLYAMVCGYFPFQGSNNRDLCAKIVKGKFDCPSLMSPECKDLIKRMLTVDASKRCSLGDVQHHSWCRTVYDKTALLVAQYGLPPPSQIDCERSEDSVLQLETEGVVDAVLVHEMVQLGFRAPYVTMCVKRNMHNLCCTTYSLLRERHISRAAHGGGQGGQGASSEASLDKSTAATHPHSASGSSTPSGSSASAQAAPARRMMV